MATGGLIVGVVTTRTATAADPQRPAIKVPNAIAATEKEMKPYTEEIPNSVVRFDMVPIPDGTFRLGSPAAEHGRNPDEGPQVDVKIAPFWMGKCEVTWDEYEEYMLCLDMLRRKVKQIETTPAEKSADAVSHPTKPFTDMTFGMGKQGYPAICMTQLAARMYCKWLTQKTGRYYRLPTEAEWEYACRAGSKTMYSFGDDPAKLDDYAWTEHNSNEKYHPVGQKKPNAWGLYDMHGNVEELVLDQYVKDHYQAISGKGTVERTLAIPKTEYPRVARGGSWKATPEQARSASRDFSVEEWKEQDPQFPQSIWYFTDARHVGFRVVRPLVEPSDKEKAEYWDADTKMPAPRANEKKGCNEG
ncbi:MAG: formylglycine-generating enzyme family protein [Planctomycetia bacterium]|nr:formylglycine-generating enzyme family protein [Planctomycetia bacterium]